MLLELDAICALTDVGPVGTYYAILWSGDKIAITAEQRKELKEHLLRANTPLELHWVGFGEEDNDDDETQTEREI